MDYGLRAIEETALQYIDTVVSVSITGDDSTAKLPWESIAQRHVKIAIEAARSYRIHNGRPYDAATALASVNSRPTEEDLKFAPHVEKWLRSGGLLDTTSPPGRRLAAWSKWAGRRDTGLMGSLETWAKSLTSQLRTVSSEMLNSKMDPNYMMSPQNIQDLIDTLSDACIVGPLDLGRDSYPVSIVAIRTDNSTIPLFISSEDEAVKSLIATSLKVIRRSPPNAPTSPPKAIALRQEAEDVHDRIEKSLTPKYRGSTPTHFDTNVAHCDYAILSHMLRGPHDEVEQIETQITYRPEAFWKMVKRTMKW